METTHPSLADPVLVADSVEFSRDLWRGMNAELDFVRQMKMSYLFGGEVLLSDGYLFDNPFLWKLLRDPKSDERKKEYDFCTAMAKHTTVLRGGLIIDHDGCIQKPSAKVSFDIFKKREGGFRPSSHRYYRTLEGRAEIKFNPDDLTFEDFGKQIGAQGDVYHHDDIERFLEIANARAKSTDRHDLFAERVKDWAISIIKSGLFEAYEFIALENVLKYIEEKGKISRAVIQRISNALWEKHADMLNLIRHGAILDKVEGVDGVNVSEVPLTGLDWTASLFEDELIDVEKYSYFADRYSWYMIAIDEITWAEIDRITDYLKNECGKLRNSYMKDCYENNEMEVMGDWLNVWNAAVDEAITRRRQREILRTINSEFAEDTFRRYERRMRDLQNTILIFSIFYLSQHPENARIITTTSFFVTIVLSLLINYGSKLNAFFNPLKAILTRPILDKADNAPVDTNLLRELGK